MRTSRAARPRAISSERLTILLILTPGAGANSYRVITGPLVTRITLALTPKSRVLFPAASTFPYPELLHVVAQDPVN